MDDIYPPIPRKAEITEKNAQTLEKALYPIRLHQQSIKKTTKGPEGGVAL